MNHPFTSAFSMPFAAFGMPQAAGFPASPTPSPSPAADITQPFAPWLTPAASAEELERRIAELKTVQFWLEQNTRALAATIQMLEVQKLTLRTLEGFNANMAQALRNWPGMNTAAATTAAAPGSATPSPASNAPSASPSAENTTATDGNREGGGGSSSSDSARLTENGFTHSAASSNALGNLGFENMALPWFGALMQHFQQVAATQASPATSSAPSASADEPTQ